MKHLSLSNQAAFSWSAQWICVTILNISENCMENFGLLASTLKHFHLKTHILSILALHPHWDSDFVKEN